MPGLTFLAQYWYPAMYASTGGILRPPTDEIVPDLDVVAAATPARQPASCSAKTMPGTFFGLPLRPAALTSMIANFVFGYFLATCAIESPMRKPTATTRSLPALAAVERFGT